MDFKRFSSDTVERVDKELKRLLEEWRKEVGKISGSLLPLVDKFITACEGGKRLRGTLVKLGYEIASEKLIAKSVKLEEKEVLKIAAAYEIFHTAILAHDDVIDQSPLRRGQPSLYQALGGDHYGTSQAICLGDAGFFLATKVIAATNFLEKEKNEALKLFSQTMVETAIGQMLDIQKGDPTTVRKFKTARYTVAGPLQLGAVLAGGKPNLLEQLDKFGENLGIAFQIKDDILDGEVKSLDLAKAQALKYMDKARKIIPRLTQDTTMRILLNELVDYMVERSK